MLRTVVVEVVNVDEVVVYEYVNVHEHEGCFHLGGLQAVSIS